MENDNFAEAQIDFPRKYIEFDKLEYKGDQTMSKVYCKHCGRGYSDARSLLANSCSRHPAGKGKHELFTGPESDAFCCKNCGSKYHDLASLTRNSCVHNPDGRGPHQPYDGGMKDKYTCRYCGQVYKDIASMIRNSCSRHPDGRGKHSPA